MALLHYDAPVPSTPMTAPANLMQINIRLSDFGQAEFSVGQKKAQVQQKILRAPEVILGLDWDAKVDIWNAACFVSGYQVVTHDFRADCMMI